MTWLKPENKTKFHFCPVFIPQIPMDKAKKTPLQKAHNRKMELIFLVSQLRNTERDILSGTDDAETLAYAKGQAQKAFEWLDKVDLKKVSQAEILLERQAIEQLMTEIRCKLT